MKYVIVDDTKSSEPNIDSDALGRLILSVPDNNNMVDMDDIYNICKEEIYPDIPEVELNAPNRREIFKLFADIWFHYAFCAKTDYIFTFEGHIVPDSELDQMFITIFTPPRFLQDKHPVDLLAQVQEDDADISSP